MTAVLVVRHAQSAWNAEGRWQGWADPDLSSEGEAQAAALAAVFSTLGFTRTVSSDLLRARRTLEILAAGLPAGMARDVDARLRERDVGHWSGLTAEEIEQRWPGQVRAWAEGRLPSPPGGETTTEILQRIRAGLGALADPTAGAQVLVVSHGGVIRTLERSLGMEARPVSNLSGRWFEVDDAGLRAGAVFNPEGPGRPS